jgi:type IV pilus assembly protein PilQ
MRFEQSLAIESGMDPRQVAHRVRRTATKPSLPHRRSARRIGLVALACAGLAAAPAGEARVSLDAKDAPVQDVVRLLAELGGFQVVFDPGLECKLTLRLHEARWLAVLDATLRACGLGYEEAGGVLRVAKTSRLIEESAARRRLEQESSRGGSGRIALFRLTYARAQALAPLLKSRLPPGSNVTWDARTNTLIVIE